MAPHTKRRIAILTGGGDAPGLNAAIRAVVRHAVFTLGWEVLGVRNGYNGFLRPDGVFPLTLDMVRGILPLGGTILGAANRGNPFAQEVVVNGKKVVRDVSDDLVARIRELNLDAVIVTGGDGTLGAALDLYRKGAPIIGIPKTIDNDVPGTDFTIGFDTAVSVAAEALDRLHTTAESHHRVMVVELMGRDAGFIALHAGIAGGADIILLPEIPFHYEVLAAKVLGRKRRGRMFSIVAVAEGATPVGGHKVYRQPGEGLSIARLGGISLHVADYLAEATDTETRALILGHLQRGGTPTARDRLLATRFGAEAVRMAEQGLVGHMVALHGTRVEPIPLEEALAQRPKRVRPDDDMVQAARAIGTIFGDEIERLQSGQPL